jgi:hypothetical protein
MGTLTAITVVEATLPSRRSLHGDIVIGFTRAMLDAAGTIQAGEAGLAVGIDHTGEGRS